MFALSIQAMLDTIASKKKEDLPIRALLYYVLPNCQFGYPENSSGEFETEAEYEALNWLDERQKPTWAELEAKRQELFDLELALDLDQLRNMRYNETTIEFQGSNYQVNPLAIATLASQLELATQLGNVDVAVLTTSKRVNKLTHPSAVDLLSMLRQRLNQWIVDPRIE